MTPKAFSHLSIKQKGLVLVAVPITFEVIFVCTLMGLLYGSEVQRSRETHLRAIVTELHSNMLSFYESGTVLAAYQSTKSAHLLRVFEGLQSEAVQRTGQIKALVADSPSSAKSLGTYAQHAQEVVRVGEILRDYISKDSRRNASVGEEFEMLAAVHTALKNVMSSSKQLIREQTLLQNNYTREIEVTNSVLVLVLLLGLFGHLLLSVFLARFFSKQIEDRLRVLSENTARLARRKPLEPRLTGSDEIAELDAVFHEMAASLNEAARRRGETLALVSHDMRGPVSSFAMMFRLMLQGKFGDLPAAAVGRLRRAENANLMLVEMIQNFLDLEKSAQEGQQSLNLKTSTFPELLQPALDGVVALAEARSIKIEVESSVTVPLLVDGPKITRVLLNLLSNAIKFSPDNGVILIDAHLHDDNLCVGCQDQGPGVPVEFQDKVFDRFLQAPSSERLSTGSGLGLAICKHFVEMHGGVVGLDKERTQGSRFWFRIPINPSNATSG